MKTFLDENFLLHNDTAQKLYHEYAAKMPIIDYHCHLSPKDIATDRRFQNLTEIWLDEDHYKWRAMRANGVDEYYITGSASPCEKFMKWAETIPYTLRNPLYHWAHLELKNVFGIEKILCPETALEIWNEANALLQTPEFSCRNLIRRANVKVICTTDDPVDSLEWHRKIREDGYDVKVCPTWRPDRALLIENPDSFNEYIDQLATVSKVSIGSFDNLLEAFKVRQQFFSDHGCVLSDHGLEAFFADDFTPPQVNDLFRKARNGQILTAEEVSRYKSALLYEFGKLDYEMGWAQQFHVGPMRNNNTRMLKALGPDAGFDSIGDRETAIAMSRYFDRLEQERKLTKTILYNLNPRDSEVYVAMAGNFQGDGIPGKIQYGSGWWFQDQKDGIIKQLNTLSALGLVSRFVGMLTDSRSVISYSRHEYFRRILCNLFGEDIENGEIPNDIEHVGGMIQDICYYNAERYFKFR
ncbi:MAG: glucuronate isomerase [Bacteroidota bacterium]|nr:glucuronate isomerase [Bacteroidota bacterium]